MCLGVALWGKSDIAALLQIALSRYLIEANLAESKAQHSLLLCQKNQHPGMLQVEHLANSSRSHHISIGHTLAIHFMVVKAKVDIIPLKWWHRAGMHEAHLIFGSSIS